MAKYRMVPEDAEEAKFIHERIKEWNEANLLKLEGADRIARLNRYSGWEIRWEQIASDLAEEEGLDRIAIAKVTGTNAKESQERPKARTADAKPETPKA